VDDTGGRTVPPRPFYVGLPSAIATRPDAPSARSLNVKKDMATDESVLFPSRVRMEVLAQHAFLRELMEQTLTSTTRGLQAEGPSVGELATSARELQRTFRAHLNFEERALLPILATEECWGPERARELLDEHARQRAELDTIIEGIELGWDRERLAFTVRSLVVDLLRDMRDEEDGLGASEILDRPVVYATLLTDSIAKHR
jgi:Hemerythrin HHE cation binding domain